MLYDFTSVRVSGFPDGGPYYGRRIDGLGPLRDFAGFPAVSVPWLADASFTRAEASEAVVKTVVNVKRLLQFRYLFLPPIGGYSDRWALSSLVFFYPSKGISAPQSLGKAVRIDEGRYSTSSSHVIGVVVAERRTSHVTTAFDEFWRTYDEEIFALKEQLGAVQDSVPDSAR